MEKEKIASWFQELQSEICSGLEKLDGKNTFQDDKWQREGGGGGLTRTFVGGDLIEKGGVNFSAVHGLTPEKVKKGIGLDAEEFFATGVSIVLHPENPWVPIIHMNVRYFEMSDGTHWFGGGIDLTPHLIIEEDARYFHEQLKSACDGFQMGAYDKYKKWADDYFYIKHRKETRGIGGIFFDRLSGPEEKEKNWKFTQEVGRTFLPTYSEIANRNRNKTYGKKEKDWQMIRRGRYVEFNLVLDKGTKFGLDTDGRTESILMSLPPVANWQYQHHPEPESIEARTLSLLRKDINWLNGIN